MKRHFKWTQMFIHVEHYCTLMGADFFFLITYAFPHKVCATVEYSNEHQLIDAIKYPTFDDSCSIIQYSLGYSYFENHSPYWNSFSQCIPLFFQLYVSVEFGRRWQLVHDGVVPNRFYWWGPNSDISAWVLVFLGVKFCTVNNLTITH